jgi:Flp pilus assembly protein TadD
MEFPQAHYVRAVANLNLRNFEAAEESAREAQKLDTQHRLPRNDHLLGVILLQKQDYAGAAQQLRTYLKFAPDSPDASSIKTQAEELEKLADAQPKENPKENPQQ